MASRAPSGPWLHGHYKGISALALTREMSLQTPRSRAENSTVLTRHCTRFWFREPRLSFLPKGGGQRHFTTPGILIFCLSLIDFFFVIRRVAEEIFFHSINKQKQLQNSNYLQPELWPSLLTSSKFPFTEVSGSPPHANTTLQICTT